MAKKKSGLMNVADLLPEPVQVDPEVKVSRQRGITPEMTAALDPVADLPVIQVDPETKVTRQRGIGYVADGNTIRVDSPEPRSQMQRMDAPLPLDHPTGVVMGAPEVQFHKPISAEAGVKVERVGIRTAKDAEKYQKAGHLASDRPKPGVQIAEVPEHQQQIPEEQRKQYASGKVFASDRVAPEQIAKPVDWQAQQMKPEDWKPVKGGVVGASMRASADAAAGKPSPAEKKAPAKKKGKARRKARGTAATRKAAAPKAGVPATPQPGADVHAETEAAEKAEKE